MILADERDMEGGVRRDLCGKHATQALKNFNWGHRHEVESKKAKPWNKADYDTINAKVMRLADSKPLFTGTDVCKVANVSPHIAKVAIQKLIADNKIAATGVNRGRRLSKVD